MVTQNYFKVSSSVNTIVKGAAPPWSSIGKIYTDTGEDAQVQTVVNSQYVTQASRQGKS